MSVPSGRPTVGQLRFFSSPLVLTAILFVTLIPQPAAHGQSGPLPNQNYYLAFGDFYQANYLSAGKDFSRGATSAFKQGTNRYLDSICFWTMMAECHYHMGNYADAIPLYEQSLDLYLAFQSQQWQTRLQTPPAIQADSLIANRVRISWGTPGRVATIPRIPNSFGVMFGRLDAERAWQEGGVLDNAEVRQIDLNEIMRCTALALHRRRVIKGPTSKYDPFTVRLINGLRGARAGNGTLLGAYNGVLLGIAEASIDEWDKAARTLNKSLQFNGNMDHTLTPVALLELANIGIETGNFAVAGKLALEASYSAAVFYQYDLVEEALSLGAQLHLMTNQTAYPPLENAILWASREKARLMQASLTVRLAECLAESGQTDLASKALQQTNAAIKSRSALPDSVVGSRMKYVAALIRFENGDFNNGMSDLAKALASFQTGSLWLYRLGLADSLVVAGSIGDRQADLLYGVLLHDPTDLDWQKDPLEAIAFLASNHVAPMERWFDIVVNRKDMDRAINISELVRRHRFFSSLPLGGRLMAFRWVMHAPEQALSVVAAKQRLDFLTRHPQYQQLTNRAEQIRTELLTKPLKSEDGSSDARDQLKLFDELGEVSNLQEAMLASFALRRQPAEMMFPPQFDLSEFQHKIGKNQLALVTLATNSGYHLFFVNASSVQYLGLGNTLDVQRSLGLLLKSLGLMDSAIEVETLQSTEWRLTAKALTEKMLGDIPASSWEKIDELVIVPDGLLWYLPFELLQVGNDDEQRDLFDEVDIRYSPTLFLAYGVQRPLRELTRTAVVSAKMHSRAEPEMSLKAFDQLLAELPAAVNYDRAIRPPSNLLGSLFDQLVVWSEIQPLRKSNPLDMQPMQLDQARTGTTVGAWMSLPWYGPEHIVLPGFNSDAGTAFRSNMNGQELFLTTTGLMAAGVRTILISRWRTGGQNSLDLSSNYASRLPHMNGSQALRESILVARDLELDYDREPQLRTKKTSPKQIADHPVFWSGLMLLAIPNEELAEPAVPALNNVPMPGDEPGR